jgi:hypothetical protein
MDKQAQRRSQSRTSRPQGQVTRGKTAHNRLRRVDLFLARYDPALLRRTDGPFAHALFVDLGFGAEPFTTLESSRRLRALNPDLCVLGVEIDRERVTAAQPHADEHTSFRLGGFNLPLRPRPDGEPETVRAVRAFNVLRQYEEEAVASAWAQIAPSVLPGGLLVEGTSDPYGRIWVANILRRQEGPGSPPGWSLEALLFSTNFRGGCEPAHFQPVLPKNLIHRMYEGEWIYDLFATWKRASLRTQAVRAWGMRTWFAASANALAAEGVEVVLHGRWLRLGFMIVKPPGSGLTT